MTPFGFDDKPKDFTPFVQSQIDETKAKIEENKASEARTFEAKVTGSVVSILDNTTKIGMITSVLKDKMNPRDLHNAMREIKLIVES